MKLQDENKLTDAELEQVAGGDDQAEDSKFLNVLLRGRVGQCGRYGAATAMFHGDELVKAWASVGVEYRPLEGKFSYRIYGKVVSRYEAWLKAEQFVGKHLKRADWDW